MAIPGAPREGIGPIVITEPTGLDVVVAHGGAITCTLDIAGKAAHASIRREGVSALDNLTYLIEALRKDEANRNAAEDHPLMQALGLPYPTIVGQVEGGNWPSTVMDRLGAQAGTGCASARIVMRPPTTGVPPSPRRQPIIRSWQTTHRRSQYGEGGSTHPRSPWITICRSGCRLRLRRSVSEGQIWPEHPTVLTCVSTSTMATPRPSCTAPAA